MLDIERMKARREELGLTQDDAAKRAGFQSRQAWNNIESGRQVTLTLATLAKLADALEMEAADLIVRNGKAPAKGKKAKGS